MPDIGTKTSGSIAPRSARAMVDRRGSLCISFASRVHPERAGDPDRFAPAGVRRTFHALLRSSRDEDSLGAHAPLGIGRPIPRAIPMREPDMSETAADRMVACLLEWGVDTVFGLPG